MVNKATEPILKLQAIHKSYRDRDHRQVLLEGLELAVQPGELVVLTGRSGCGKSTLLNIIGGIDLPDAGSVHFGTTRLDRLDEEGRTLIRRRHIGMVFQFFNLVPTLTVTENLLLPLALNNLDSLRQRALERLELLGLTQRQRAYPEQLSGGEQQRLAIARALAHEPSLILADEPTGNLDPETGNAVMQLLLDLIQQQGCTLVMVTHSMELADRADRVLQLHHGHLQTRSST